MNWNRIELLMFMTFIMCLILYTITEKNKEKYCIICIFYIKGKLYIHIHIFIIMQV